MAAPASNQRLHVQRWGSRATWATLDQALFATGNFALNVLLARKLALEDYGAFTLAHSVILLAGTAHTALLAEPMLVFGAGKYKRRWPQYLRGVVDGHWAFGALWLFPLLIVAAVFWGAGWSETSRLLVLMGLTGPLIWYQWLVRRASYAAGRPRLATVSGVVYLTVLLAQLYILTYRGALTPESSLASVGISSLISAYQCQMRLGPARRLSRRARCLFGRDHLTYGRWIVGVGVLLWLPSNVLYLLLSMTHSMDATGMLRALTNLMQPVSQFLAAMGSIALPALVSVGHSRSEFVSLLRLLLLTYIGAAALYWVVFNAFREALLTTLYGSQLALSAWDVMVVTAIPLASAVVATTNAGLKALGNPSSVFRGYVWAALFCFLPGAVLVILIGLRGALIVLVTSQVILACANSFRLVHIIRRSLGR